MLRKSNHKKIICPWDQDQFFLQAKKWSVTVQQLNEAILQTGSIDADEIKKYLIEKGILFSLFKWMNYLKLSK